MSIRRGGNIVAGSVNKKEIVDLIENETRVNIKTITGTLTTASSTISLNADDLVNGSQILSVNLGNTVILPNLYSLSNGGKTLTFVETIDANTNYAISYVKKFDIGSGGDIDLSGYATKADLDSKQNKLTAGENISINNNIISSTTTIDPNIANWSNNVTNCITEIPQDIKLELGAKYAWYNGGFVIYLYTDSTSVSVNDKVYGNDDINVAVGTVTQVSGNTITIYFPEEYDAIPAGAEVDFTRDSSVDRNGILTLKSGSKVYVPNGANKFDVITTNSDISFQGSDTVSVSRVVYYNKTTNGFLVIGSHSSGTTGTPNNTTGNCVHYNTSTNKIQLYINGVAQSGEISLPLCIVKSDGKNIVGTIDQVFNGFGYIGSTVFALPGVKALHSNGRNSDGSLKNEVFEITQVITETKTNQNTLGQFILRPNAIQRAASVTEWEYDEQLNYFIYKSNGDTGWVDIGTYTEEHSGIKSLNIKNPFHALDYNDKSEIIGWGMPSNKADVLTLGASGASYAAPANGYFAFFAQYQSGADAWVNIQNLNTTAAIIGMEHFWYSSKGSARLFCPAKKGDKIAINYNGVLKGVYFYFIYAEGEK